MLASAMSQGARDALDRLGIKEADGLLASVGRSLIGQPGRLFSEGARSFRPGGFLSARNVLWPAVSGPGGSKLNWLNRAGTMMMPLQIAGAMRSNPEEGRLSRLLGAAGGVAGLAYGYPALGMLGAPLASALGSHVGHGVGHLLGSEP